MMARAFVESRKGEHNPEDCYRQHLEMNVLDHTKERLKLPQQAKEFPDPVI
jgi:hypothetical protein